MLPSASAGCRGQLANDMHCILVVLEALRGPGLCMEAGIVQSVTAFGSAVGVHNSSPAAPKPFSSHFAEAMNGSGVADQTQADAAGNHAATGPESDATPSAGKTASSDPRQDEKANSSSKANRSGNSPAQGSPSGSPHKNESPNSGTAAPVVSSTSTSSNASSSASDDGEVNAPSAKRDAAAGQRLSWLISMIPEFSANQREAGAASAPSSAASAPESQAGQSGKAADDSGKDDGGASASGGNSSGAAAIGVVESKSAASEARAPDPVKVLMNSASAVSSAAQDPKVADGSSSGAPSTSPDDVRSKAEAPRTEDVAGLQNAMRTLETSGLTLLSKTTSADGGALPVVFPAKSSQTTSAPSVLADANASAASSAAHAGGAVHSSQTAGNDPNGTGAGQAAAHVDAPAAVKPPAASTSAGSKNGSSPDSGSKATSSPQTSATAVAAVSGSAAMASSTAVQTAPNSAPAIQNQTAANSSSLAHSGASTQSNPAASAGDKLAAAMDAPLNTTQPVVSAASMVQAQGRSEMRVAVQTESMGAVQLHAVLDGGRVGASISVVGHEAHTLLNNELPALQQVLTDHNLRVDHLTVVNSPMSSGAGSGGAHHFESRSFDQPPTRDTRWYSPVQAVADVNDASAPAEIRGRLSVRA